MKTATYKAIRDLTKHKTRSLLAILAIAIGVTGFGGILSTHSILTRELNSGYLASNPASATVWVDQLDSRLISKVQRLPEIADVEERRTITGVRMRASGDWKNGVLFVIKDFSDIRISTVKPQSGKWPPASGEILIERDAFGVAGIKIGEELLIKTPERGEARLKVTGSVHDVGQAQARMEQLVYGYIDADTLERIGYTSVPGQLKVVVAGNKYDQRHVEATIQRLKTFIQKQGYTVRKVDIPEPGKHPHADLMGTLLLVKASFGLFALILSGVLVMNLISAIMAGQVRQVGVMKAVGARSFQIMRIYLFSVAALSCASLVIAIPGAILTGRWLAVYMSRFLNFDLQSYTVAWPVILLEISAALIVPLLASLYPVWKGSRVTVREAITNYGIREQFGFRRSDRLLTFSSGRLRPLLLSIRNTFRQRLRLVLIVATMAAGGAIFMSAWNVRSSLIRTVDQIFSSLHYDVAISLASLSSTADIERMLRHIPGIDHVESWTVIQATIPDTQFSVNLVGYPQGTKALALHIVEGRPLLAKEERKLVVNSGLAAQNSDFRVGNRIRLQTGTQTLEWEIVGLARQAMTGPAAYTNQDYLLMLSGETGKTKTIRLITSSKDANAIARVKSSVERQLEVHGIETMSVISMVDRRHVIDEHNSVIYMFLIIMALLIVVVGGLGLMTVMSINVLERQREIGVLRAIGATRRQVLRIILTEGSLIGLLSWLIAVPVSATISTSLGNIAAARILRTRLEYTPDLSGILIWLVVVIVFGAVASFLPAWNASRKTVRELVAYE